MNGIKIVKDAPVERLKRTPFPVSGLKGLADYLKEKRKDFPEPKCVKCGSVFGLYTYNEELWCPKCLVARIHLLEGILKGQVSRINELESLLREVNQRFQEK